MTKRIRLPLYSTVMIANCIVGLMWIVVLCTRCAQNTPPQTTITQYTGTVLKAATSLQNGITAATDAKSLPVPVAQQLSGYVKIIYDRSGPLLDALKVYNAAATLDMKKSSAADIQSSLVAINTAVGQILGTAIPPGVLTQLSKLIGNVMSAVGVVQSELAKGLGS